LIGVLGWHFGFLQRQEIPAASPQAPPTTSLPSLNAKQLLTIKSVPYNPGTPGEYRVEGTLNADLSRLDRGRTIWIANRIHTDDKATHVDDQRVAFSYGPCRVDDDLSWSCSPIYLGEACEVGHQFDLFAVLLTSEQSQDVISSLMDPKKSGVDMESPSTDATDLFPRVRLQSETTGRCP
jgi:hypothetical protein